MFFCNSLKEITNAGCTIELRVRSVERHGLRVWRYSNITRHQWDGMWKPHDVSRHWNWIKVNKKKLTPLFRISFWIKLNKKKVKSLAKKRKWIKLDKKMSNY